MLFTHHSFVVALSLLHRDKLFCFLIIDAGYITVLKTYLVLQCNTSIILTSLLYADLLGQLILHSDSFFLLSAMFLQSEALLDLLLMTITGIEEFSSLLSCNIGQFLGSLLLVGQTPDPIFESLILANLIM